MADNAPTTPAAKGGTNLLELAVGLSILDAIGNGGEVVARRNSSFFNNSFDAFGLPRNRFTLMQNIVPRQEDSPMWGMDLRSILGGNAEVYSTNRDYNSSGFGMGVMNMLFGNGIFGMVLGGVGNGISQEANNLQQILSGNGAQFMKDPPATAPATGQPPASTAGRTQPGPGGYTDEYGETVTSPGGAAIGPATTRTTPVVETASAGRRSSTVVAATASSTEPATVSTSRMMPLDTKDSDGLTCEVPKPDAPAKLCTTTRPKAPGGP